MLIVITGPTATGKTKLGAQVAKELGGEVISADSMQIYKEMNIGTAKPTALETDGVPHHMIDVASPGENYSVARYVREATACVEDILGRGRQPVIVGGSGLYIDSLIRGRIFAQRANPALRRKLEERYDKEGGAEMLRYLAECDKPCADRLFENDKKRIVRALEVYLTTGIPISKHDDAEKALPDKYKAVKFALTYSERHVLYDKIRKRVDNMMSAGLVDEVKKLLDSGLTQENTAMKAIGYKEIAEAIINNTAIDEAVEKIKTNSTRYAKRQLTWLRRDDSVNWIIWDKEPDFDSAAGRISETLPRAQCLAKRDYMNKKY